MTRGITGKKILKFIGLSVLFCFMVGYGVWIGRDLIFGISLNISGIQNNETVATSTLDLTGMAYHATEITVNGRTVSVEENGAWHDTIALLNGYNIIKVSAKDKFGRTISKVFTINYAEPPSKMTPAEVTPTTPATSTATSTSSVSH